MEIAGKLLLGMALILAILGVGALVLAKLGVERLPPHSRGTRTT